MSEKVMTPEEKTEYIVGKAMEIIMNSGDARNFAAQAFDKIVEGDYEAARQLVENYGVSIDPELHHEVLERYRKLNLAPYKGFVNPVLTAETDADGNISDVTVDYTEGYAEQMLRYSRDYSL